MIRHIRFHIIESVTVSVEAVCMVNGGVSEPPALQKGIDPNYIIYYGLYGYNYVHNQGIPVGIL